MKKWITPALERTIAYYLEYYGAIPDYVGYYSPLITKGIPSINQNKLLPSQSNYLLHLEKELLFKEAEAIASRLKELPAIRIIGISEVSIECVSPLLLELSQTENLVEYVSLTPNKELNKINMDQAKTLLEENGSKEISTKSLLVEAELNAFDQEIKALDEGKIKPTNIFLLLASRLGNSLTPATLVENISKSMQTGDLLIVVQGLYKKGSEELLLKDYRQVLDDEVYAENDDEIAGQISPNPTRLVRWFKEEQAQGVQLSIRLEKDTEFVGQKLKKDQEIELFRSIRFEKEALETIFKKSGLSLLQASYDDQQNFGLYLLKKGG